jgi:hypothetical protein
MIGISIFISQHGVTQRTILSNCCNKIYENASIMVVTKCGNAIQLVNLVVMVAAVAVVVVLIKGKIVRAQRIKHYVMKAYGGADVEIHIFLTSALVGGEWSASRTGRFIPGKEPPVRTG